MSDVPTPQEDVVTDDGGPQKKKQRIAGIYQRKRAVTACETCRLRKTKCDNLRPKCGFCQRTGARCVFRGAGTGDFSTFDPASLVILDRLDHVVSLLESRPAEGAAITNLSPEYISSLADTDHHGPGVTSTQPLVSENKRKSTEPPVFWADSPEYPSAVNNCESVLRWPIFGGIAPGINSFVLQSEKDFWSDDHLEAAGGGFYDEDLIPLSKKFLADVHVKNPILDVSEFNSMVRDVAEGGPKWDGASCLVLIACALGCISTPLIATNRTNATNLSPLPTSPSTSDWVDRKRATSYYVAARKRLGLLNPSILYLQCLFFFGVFEMYSLRPMKAWVAFNRACREFQCLVWARKQKQPTDPAIQQRTRLLEQRLHWSCMKSDFELRSEIPLLPNDNIQHTELDVFPSPPVDLTSPGGPSEARTPPEEQSISVEERSWFYYLAEISFRKMMNTAIVVMGREGEQGWLRKISALMKQCEDLDEQINTWQAHIPPQINIDLTHDELASFVYSRGLASREWIHRPFLYYVIHQSPDDQYFEQTLPLAKRCLDLCVEQLFRSLPNHRHHGTWFIARAALTRGLLLLAAAKSGNISLPERWREALDIVVWTLERWSPEAPDLEWASSIFNQVLATI